MGKLKIPDFVQTSGASFSPCEKYRYALWRIWDANKKAVMFCGLNPSVADEVQDDRTVRRCIDYAVRWGFGGLYMLNVFAYRSTDRSVLSTIKDPVGPDNDMYLKRYYQRAGMCVAAWGADGALFQRDLVVIGMLDTLHCLGVNKNNTPKHPLYLKANLIPVNYCT